MHNYALIGVKANGERDEIIDGFSDPYDPHVFLQEHPEYRKFYIKFEVEEIDMYMDEFGEYVRY